MRLFIKCPLNFTFESTFAFLETAIKISGTRTEKQNLPVCVLLESDVIWSHRIITEFFKYLSRDI